MDREDKSNRWKKDSKRVGSRDLRVKILAICLTIFAGLLGARLFFLQVLDQAFYEAMASGLHEKFQELFPARGEIFVHDEKDDTLVAVATNQKLSLVYADPRQIKDVVETIKQLTGIFAWDEEIEKTFALKFANQSRRYEPIKNNVNEETLEKILALKLPGINYLRKDYRLYPEVGLGGQVFGFVGANEDGSLSGKYGIEGYFEDILAGTPGFLRSERDIAGRLIVTADRAFQPAVDGADIVLTLDRNIQYEACSRLKAQVAKYSAEGGSIIIVEPATGRILAMCGAPDFDPNNYSQVANINQFNNPATFNAYESGSVFKPFTMAAALDAGAIEPNTTFEDTGSVMVGGWSMPISNAENKSYGVVNMTQVLESSINTGTIFAMRQMGQDKFIEYLKKFGFGEKTRIELNSEGAGNLSSLDQKAEVFAATATFGQGITVTPLQLTMGYAALANHGVLLQPQIIDEVRYADGRVEKRAVKEVRQVISDRTAELIDAMLVSVVENGHGKPARVPGYYIGGKTGTAQVASAGGYENNQNIGTFGGFGPVSNPRFAMVVRIDNPQGIPWAESSAAPLFGEVADFLLRYYQVPPER
ncbi:MAG: penicillin-binding protein 2 [Candidatus Uhrbacteria bacterium]